ncbi:unnamed protein product [Amoebophrya sp. A120]|nr:unnamed protein product [Amoebophrya sp. A120]|eukprot:GSA120T00017222001.1
MGNNCCAGRDESLGSNFASARSKRVTAGESNYGYGISRDPTIINSSMMMSQKQGSIRAASTHISPAAAASTRRSSNGTKQKAPQGMTQYVVESALPPVSGASQYDFLKDEVSGMYDPNGKATMFQGSGVYNPDFDDDSDDGDYAHANQSFIRGME